MSISLKHIAAGLAFMGTIGLVLLFGSSSADALSIFLPFQGGTGTSTIPVAGDLLMSWANGSYGPTKLIAGSNVTISTSTYNKITISSTASGGTGNVATSTNETAGGLAYFTSNSATPALVGEVSTSSPTAGSGITITGTGSVIGSLTFTNAIGYPFPSNATSTLLTFSGGASTTAFSANTLAVGQTGTTSISSAGVITTPVTSALLLTSSGGAVSGYGGTSCTNQFVRSLSALGAATCATVSASDVSLANLTATDSTLTFSGTYNGSTARTIGLNLGNANTWTALQQFTANASTTGISATQAWFGGTATTSIDSTGKLTVQDTNNSWSGIVSPTRSFVLQTGTTTTWTATTSGAYVPTITMPFAGTLKQVRCQATSTIAFLTVMPRINHTATTPSSFVSSSTVGVIKFTANNTFVAGDVISIYVGTSTAHAATSDTCTFDAIQTS